MYKIKQTPEDFIVEEVMDLPKNSGSFSYFLLTKRNKNTYDSLDFIANKFNIDVNRISFSGLKDKNAITSQYIAIHNLEEKYKKDFELGNVKIKFLGCFDKPIYRGQHISNKFDIVVRNLDKKYKKVNFVENYFDEQRFSQNNVEVGKAIVKKNFALACKILGKFDSRNPISFLRKEYGKNLRFFVNAYQSYLFNIILFNLLKDKKDARVIKYENELLFAFCSRKRSNIKIPLINFDSEIKSDKLKRIYEVVLRKEGVKKEDFLIRQIPEIVSQGTTRDSQVNIKWKSILFLEDELNKGKIKSVLSFCLPKGAFGTILVKKVFS